MSWLRNKLKGGEDITDSPNSNSFNFSLDSPFNARITEDTFDIVGWFFSKYNTSLYVEFCGNVHILHRNILRQDVERAFPDIEKSITKKAGFQLTLPSKSGNLVIYIIDENNHKIIIEQRNIEYEPELLARDMYVHKLDKSIPEHKTLIEANKKYYFEDEYPHSFEPHAEDARLIAFYLPQFHPIPENDKAWGNGFTEWTNVTAAEARFAGHQQPLLPGRLGFYDLRNPQVLENQIELAKKSGLSGFCFYYYWFSGRKLLDKPLELFLEHKEWDFNFMVCWANENWTKRWDGMDNEVILAQRHFEDDPTKFIKDMENILIDPRYIRVDNKPVLMVYRPSQLDHPERYLSIWRKYMKDRHGLELHVISSLGFDDEDVKKWGFDHGVEFEPLMSGRKNGLSVDEFHDDIKYLSYKSDITLASYRKFISSKIKSEDSRRQASTNYKSVFPSWDNDARKKGKGSTVFYDANPDSYLYWLNKTLSSLHKKNKALIFVNAWNEWAEGAVLEPRSDWGSVYLNRSVEALAAHSKNSNNSKNFPIYGIPKTRKKLAVVVHLYYPELWSKIADKLEAIDQPYDLFVSLPEKHKAFKLTASRSSKVYKYVVPNRGRDVLPFLQIIKKLQYAGYSYVLKLHTKKSLHRSDGDEWLDTTLDQLLPNTNAVKNVIEKLSSQKTAYIGPESHHVDLGSNMGSNESALLKVISFVTSNTVAVSFLDDQSFFAGTMFWARLDALQPIIDASFIPGDFESESGQIDGTLAHALERSFLILAQIAGKQNYRISSRGRLSLAVSKEATKDYKYVQQHPKV